MAVDFSKFNFFSRLNARSRVLVLLGVVIGLIVLVYIGTRYIAGSSDTTGPSNVANAPQGLQSVPGGTLSPEYQRALQQANLQREQQAQVSGGSAIPTLINIGNQQASGNCNIICSDQNANVKTLLDDWVKQGKLTPEVSQALSQLADKNVSVDEYADALNQMVKDGKLTPEQARELLEQYKKQHANNLLQDSAKDMDAMIKAGQLPLDAANQLLTAQKNNMNPDAYAATLQDLVNQGKISPQTAQELLAQYTAQRAKEIVMQSIAFLRQLSAQGQITPDVLNQLIDLENRLVPLDIYGNTLQQNVNAGKLTPAVADRILKQYRGEKDAIGSVAALTGLLKKAEDAAYAEINDLMSQNKMSADVGAQLTSLIQQNVSFEDYQNVINQLVQQNKLTPDIAKLKIEDYRKVKGLRDMLARLKTLQANNASVNSYADELKKAVQAGLISPDEAATLMKEYQAMLQRPTTGTPIPSPGVTTPEFAALQQRVAQLPVNTQPAITADQFATTQVQTIQINQADQQARIDNLASAMSAQAGQLVAAWQPPTLLERVGSYEVEKRREREEAEKSHQSENGKNSSQSSETGGIPLIKAGTIIFAVLETEANSDYPDSPVMATLVEGPFKGGKLMGKLVTAKNVAGQLDRISLNFTLMNLDSWTSSKSVTAYAIDPEKARTVMATSVDNHYLMRYGAIMATSFIQGYANAIQSSSSTTTTGIFGTSTTHPALDPTDKFRVALGQIGQNLSTVTQNWINIPPTVKVDSGVSIGILFMSDVT